MRALTLFFLFGLAGSVWAEPLKVVVPDFNAVGPSHDKAVFYTEHISGRLSEVGAQVTTQRALQQLLGIERQRQLLGCSGEGGSCMAELANALGTDAVLLGDVAQIDTLFQINLKLISGANGKVVSTYQARVNSEGALLDELDKAAFALVADAAPILHRDAPMALRRRGASIRLLATIPLGIGVLTGVASGVLFGLMSSAYGNIPQKPGDKGIPDADAQAYAKTGGNEQLVAFLVGGVAVAALATALVMFIVGKPADAPAPVKAALFATPNGGGAFTFGGTF